MISFEAACRDDPEKLFGSQGFRLSGDPEGQMVVLFANSECKDLFKVKEATGDVFPLFVVNGFDVAPVVLRLFDFSVGIVKKNLARRGPSEDLPADVGGVFPVKVAGVVSEEAEHQDRSTHERLSIKAIHISPVKSLLGRDVNENVRRGRKFPDDKKFLEIVTCLSGGFLLKKRPSAGHLSLESRER
jgi:hypothetical protein